MLMIRFSRVGKIKQPLYRLLISEKTKDPWGDYLENLGTYDPKTKEVKFNMDRIKYWISKGAQVSATVWNILISKGIVEGKKRTVTKISNVRKGKLKDKVKADEDKAAADKLKAEEEAKARAEAEVAAKAHAEEEAKAKEEAEAAEKANTEAQAKAAAEAPAVEPAPAETPAPEPAPEPVSEAPESALDAPKAE